MLPQNYNIREDESFLEFVDEKNYSTSSRKKYGNSLKNYTNYHELTLNELIQEAEEEEDKQIRKSKRKLKRRLIKFRKHLIDDLGYSAWSVKTNMICVKAYYKYYGIEIPEIQNIPLPPSPNESIEFEDLPTVQDFRTAIESTKLQKHKALILFALCTGSARNELATFTFKQFLDGVNPYCNDMAKTPEDVIKFLDGKCEEEGNMVIPVFRMIRGKTNYPYHTIITPECLQFMINYLKAEGMNLKDDDPFFQLSNWGVSNAFRWINEKFSWGKRGTRGYFTTHRIRALHASLIEDKDFANYIEGRKPDPIMQAYFKRDPDRIKEKYIEHMYKFTIYAHYDVMINSEAYNDLKEQLEEERRKNKAYEEEISQLRSSNNALQTQMTNIQDQIDMITQSTNIERVQKYIQGNETVEKYSLSSKIIELFKDDVKNGRASSDVDYMESLICRAYNHLIAEGEFPNPLEPPADTINDERMQKIRKETDEAYYHIIENQGVRVSKAQDKKIKRKLEIYELSTYNAGKEANIGDITEIIWDIIFNG